MYRIKNTFKRVISLTVAFVLVLSLFSSSFSTFAADLSADLTYDFANPGEVNSCDILNDLSSLKLPKEIIGTPKAVSSNGSSVTNPTITTAANLTDYSLTKGSYTVGTNFYRLKSGTAYTDTTLDSIYEYRSGAYTQIVVPFKTPIKLSAIVVANTPEYENWRTGEYEIFASSSLADLFLPESRVHARDNKTEKNQVELYKYKSGKELRYISYIAIRITKPHADYDLNGSSLSTAIRSRIFEFNAYGTPENANYDVSPDFTVNYNKDSINLNNTVKALSPSFTYTKGGETKSLFATNGDNMTDYDDTTGGEFASAYEVFFDTASGYDYKATTHEAIGTRHVNGLNKNTGEEQYVTIETELMSKVDIEDILVVNHKSSELMTGLYEIFAAEKKEDLYKNSIVRFDNSDVKQQIQDIHFDTDKELKNIKFVAMRIYNPITDWFCNESISRYSSLGVGGTIHPRLMEFNVYGKWSDPNFDPDAYTSTANFDLSTLPNYGTNLVAASTPSFFAEGTRAAVRPEFPDSVKKKIEETPTNEIKHINLDDTALLKKEYLDIQWELQDSNNLDLYRVKGFAYQGAYRDDQPQYFARHYQVYVAEEAADLYKPENMVFEYDAEKLGVMKGIVYEFPENETPVGSYIALRIIKPNDGLVSSFDYPRLSLFYVWGEESNIAPKPANLAENMPIDAYFTKDETQEIFESNLTGKEVMNMTDSSNSTVAKINTKNSNRKTTELIYNLCGDMDVDRIALNVLNNSTTGFETMKVYASNSMDGVSLDSALIWTQSMDGQTDNVDLSKTITSDNKIRYVRFVFEGCKDYLQINTINIEGLDNQKNKLRDLTDDIDVKNIDVIRTNLQSSSTKELEFNVYEEDHLTLATLFDGAIDTYPVVTHSDTKTGDYSVVGKHEYEMTIMLDDFSTINQMQLGFLYGFDEYYADTINVYIAESIDELAKAKPDYVINKEDAKNNEAYKILMRPRLARYIKFEFKGFSEIDGTQIPDINSYMLTSIIPEMSFKGTKVTGMQTSGSDTLISFEDNATGIKADILRLGANDIFTDVVGMRITSENATTEQMLDLRSFFNSYKVVDKKIYKIEFVDIYGNVVKDLHGRKVRVFFPVSSSSGYKVGNASVRTTMSILTSTISNNTVRADITWKYDSDNKIALLQSVGYSDSYWNGISNCSSHTYVSGNAVAATCNSVGKTAEVYCSVCGVTQTASTEIPVIPHTPDNEAVVDNEVEATCSHEGSYDNVVHCIVCDEELSRETITVAALSHTKGEPVRENEVAPDNENAGSYDKVVYCTVCGAEISRDTIAIPALNHTAGEVVVENVVAATCTTEGSYDNVFYCTKCKEEISRETITVDALGHTEETVAGFAATCTEAGLTDGTKCSVCGETLKLGDVIKPLGHTAGEIVVENEVAAKCTVVGSYDNVVYCTVCNGELSREKIIVPALGHKEVVVSGYAATCTQSGLTDGTKCSVCGVAIKEQEVIEPSHTPGEAVIEPSSTIVGSYDKVVYCTVCETELSRKTVEAYDGISGVTMVNTKLNAGYDSSKVTFEDAVAHVEAKVSEPYASADNTLQISGMDQTAYTALIGGRTNLLKDVTIQTWANKDTGTWSGSSKVSYLKDGKIYGGSGVGPYDGIVETTLADYDGQEKGTARVAAGVYDYLIAAELETGATIDAFTLMGSVDAKRANSIYKVYVGNDKATLFNDENEVFYYNQDAVYTTYGNDFRFNGLTNAYAASGAALATWSEGAFLTFAGENKPTGKFVGIKLIDSQPGADNALNIFELGIYGKATNLDITGVTLTNKTLNAGYDSSKVTFDDAAARIKAKVPAPYASKNNTLQISGMDQAAYTALIGGRANRLKDVTIQTWANRGTGTWTDSSKESYLKDGKIYGSGISAYDGIVETNMADYDGTAVGTARVEAGVYDYLISAELEAETVIDAFTLMGSVDAKRANSIYKVYVGNDRDSLFNDANEVFYYDQGAVYTTYGNDFRFNGLASTYAASGASTVTWSEGAFLTFAGETKPTGKFVGIKLIDSQPGLDNALSIYELGIYGTKADTINTDIVGLTLTNKTLNAGYDSSKVTFDDAAALLKAKIPAPYASKNNTLQISGMNQTAYTALIGGRTNRLKDVTIQTWANRGTGTWTDSSKEPQLKDGKIYGSGISAYDGIYEASLADYDGSETGTARVAAGVYDYLISAELDDEIVIDAFTLMGSVDAKRANSIYKVYVGNDRDSLFNDANEVFYYDQGAVYTKYGNDFRFNGLASTYAASGASTATWSEGAFLTFAGETKPAGKFVGIKLIDSQPGLDNALSIYELGIYGTSYDAIQTIHNELVEVVPCNGYLPLIPGAQVQFKVNTYGDTQITAVKMVKDGKEDITLTANDGVYTTPKLEEGMKIKVETTTDDTAPFNGVWNGVDLSKNSSVYDPKIWDDGITYNESAMIYDGRTTVMMLYPIDEVISVRSYDLQTVYYPGKDYIVTADGQLQIPEGSRIKVHNDPSKFTNIIYNEASGIYDVNWGALAGWESTQWQYQIMVTYKHNTTWGIDALYENKPAGEMDSLLSFYNKATSGETTNVVFCGDSVGLGCSSTGLNESSWSYVDYNTDAPQLEKITASKASTYGLDANNLPDWVCDTWPRAVANALKKQYGDNITYTNRSIGGSASSWGAKDANLDFLLGEGDTENPCPVPDLLFIHYGLNEMTAEKATQKSNIEKIINYVRTRNPNCAVVLVSAFHPAQYTKEANPELTSGNIPLFEEAYYEIANQYDNVIVAPIYSMTNSMLSVKTPMDYTHNLFNHPNDFGARVYASTIISLLETATACDHVEEVVAGKAATCTEAGLTDGVKCSVCGETLTAQVEIPALGHTEETVPGKAATCTEAGLTDGTKCSVCGETLTAQKEIPALGHTEETIPGKAATCTETGLTDGTKCSVCGETLEEQVEIPALGHTEETIPGKAATCTEAGLTDGTKCSVCGETLTAQVEIPALGHTEETIPGKAATCTEAGLTDGVKCSVCGETLTAQKEIPALGHTEETVPGKAATCTETGLTDGVKCSVCGETLTAQVEIPALGHTGGEAVKENKVAATCTTAGSYDNVVYCTDCGAELSRETITIPALGHTEEAIAGKDATCDEPGLTAGVKCSVCGETITAQEEIPALGHDFSVENFKEGKIYCANGCGEAENMSTVKFLGKDDVVLYETFVGLSGRLSPEDIKAAEDATPYVFGYTFAGWDTDLEGEIVENATITAKYERETTQYNVSVTYVDGTLDSAMIEFDQRFTVTDENATAFLVDGQVVGGAGSVTLYGCGELEIEATDKIEATEISVAILKVDIAPDIATAGRSVLRVYTNIYNPDEDAVITESGIIAIPGSTYDEINNKQFTIESLQAEKAPMAQFKSDANAKQSLVTYGGIAPDVRRVVRAYAVINGTYYYSDKIVSNQF